MRRADSAGPAEGLLPPALPWAPVPRTRPGPPRTPGPRKCSPSPTVSRTVQRLAASPEVRRPLRIRGSVEVQPSTPGRPSGCGPPGPGPSSLSQPAPVAPPRPPPVTTERSAHRRNRPGGTRVSFRFEAGTARRAAASAHQVGIGPAELSAKAHPSTATDSEGRKPPPHRLARRRIQPRRAAARRRGPPPRPARPRQQRTATAKPHFGGTRPLGPRAAPRGPGYPNRLFPAPTSPGQGTGDRITRR